MAEVGLFDELVGTRLEALAEDTPLLMTVPDAVGTPLLTKFDPAANPWVTATQRPVELKAYPTAQEHTWRVEL